MRMLTHQGRQPPQRQRLSPRYKGQGTGEEEINAGRRFKFPTASPSSLAPSCPVEIRPYVCTALAADPAGEALLDIGQPGIIGPRIAADRDGAATAVVGAIDQQAAHAMSRISAKVIFCGLADMAQRHTASMQHRQCWSGVAYFGRP